MACFLIALFIIDNARNKTALNSTKKIGMSDLFNLPDSTSSKRILSHLGSKRLICNSDIKSRKLALGDFRDNALFADDHSVQRRGGKTAEGHDRIAIKIIGDSNCPALAVEVALTAALTVLRISDYGFVGDWIKIENIQRTNFHTVFTADTFI